MQQDPFYFDDPHDDVISSPIAYPQLNWEPPDEFSFEDSRKDFLSNDFTINFDSTMFAPDIDTKSTTQPNQNDQVSFPIQAIETILKPKPPMVKRARSTPKIMTKTEQLSNGPKLTSIFKPFADCFSAEVTVQRLRSQISFSNLKC